MFNEIEKPIRIQKVIHLCYYYYYYFFFLTSLLLMENKYLVLRIFESRTLHLINFNQFLSLDNFYLAVLLYFDISKHYLFYVRPLYRSQFFYKSTLSAKPHDLIFYNFT